jgi:imidazolonepropionase
MIDSNKGWPVPFILIPFPISEKFLATYSIPVTLNRLEVFMLNADIVIRHAKELLTLAGPERPRKGKEMSELSIIPDGALAIANGHIIVVGTDAEIAPKYHAEHEIDATGKVVMPGFVDSHTHPVFVNTRENEFEMRLKGKTYVEISQSGGGIRSSIAAVRSATENTLIDLAIPRLKRMIAQGSTTIEIKSGYGLTTGSELKMLHAMRFLAENLPADLVSTFMGAHEYPEEFKNDHEGYLQILENEMLPAIAEQHLARYCDIFTEKHVFSVEESRRVLTKARELGFRLRIHADEIEPIGGAELAAELGAISADHLGAVSDSGIDAMAKAGTIATLLPATIFSLGLKSYAPARKFIEAGVAVALATDFNPGSCHCDNMQDVITIACLQMRMTPAEAIVASTVNGAWALERGHRTGTLEKGRQADVLVMNMPSYRYLPYHIGYNDVETVIHRGRTIFCAQGVPGLV